MAPKAIKAARRELACMWPTSRRILSQADLGRVLGVSDQTVGSWEAGRTAMHPSAALLLEVYLAGQLPPIRLRILKG